MRSFFVGFGLLMLVSVSLVLTAIGPVIGRLRQPFESVSAALASPPPQRP